MRNYDQDPIEDVVSLIHKSVGKDHKTYQKLKAPQKYSDIMRKQQTTVGSPQKRT